MFSSLPSNTKRRVLVVDDERDICELLQVIFTDAGMMVDTAGTAREALQLYGAKPYDLITLDCSMPGTDGIELHRTFSQVFGFGRRVSPLLPQRLPPILVITGWAEDASVRDMIFSERVVGIIQKPIRCKELLKVAGDLMDWENHRRQRRATALTRINERRKSDPKAMLIPQAV